jgi:predicted 3-demethylubiquinone-9 3-methyltransferase (glyoxalase superfamily)
MSRFTPCIGFDTQAGEAAEFYVSVFKNSRIKQITYYGEHGPMPQGTVLTASFEIDGQEFLALNGGPYFKLTEGVSFIVNCDSQAEIDEYWAKLTADGGQAVQCGWLKDKFGLSWQINPRKIDEWLKDPVRAERVMAEVMKMVKIDMATLERAYNG